MDISCINACQHHLQCFLGPKCNKLSAYIQCPEGGAEPIKSSCTKQFITAHMPSELFWGGVKTLLVYKSPYA